MTRPFNAKLSYRLDRAVIGDESGSKFWRVIRRAIEWWIFGGRL